MQAGFYTAQTALNVNQIVLDTISNNIANANTKGYSRQRAELETNAAMPFLDANTSVSPGQLGTGVQINNIIQIRDKFLDSSYRTEFSALGFQNEKTEILTNLENYLLEPADTGLLSTLDNFFNAGQELSNNPESLPIRTHFVQKALEVAQTLNTQANDVTNLRTNLVGDPAVAGSLTDSNIYQIVNNVINPKLAQIADLNSDIVRITVAGANPNELLDRRALLLDEISEYIPISVTEGVNNNITISLGANTLIRNTNHLNELSVGVGTAAEPATISLVDPTTAVVNVANANASINNGILGSILELGGSGVNNYTLSGVLNELDLFSVQLANTINTLQTSGRAIDSSVNPLALIPAVENIFTSTGGPITASTITVNTDVSNDPFLIAAAGGGADGIGAGDNAITMAQSGDTINAALGNLSLKDYVRNTLTNVGVELKSSQEQKDNQQLLLDNINSRRQNIAGVNLDEEFASLIRFQRAYEASTRVIKAIDESLQSILNIT